MASVLTCTAQTNTDEVWRQLDAQRRQIEQDFERSRAQSRQLEAESIRLRDEYERLRAEREARDAAERAERAAARQEEMAKRAAVKAEEEASNLRDEMNRANVRTWNGVYVAALTIMFLAFGGFLV